MRKYLILVVLLLTGCENKTAEQMNSLSSQQTEQGYKIEALEGELGKQALQYEKELQRVHTEISKTNERVIKSDAALSAQVAAVRGEATAKHTILQHDLQRQEKGLKEQKDRLESTWNDIAKHTNVWIAIGCMMPLLFCGLILWWLRKEGADEDFVEVLAEYAFQREILVEPVRGKKIKTKVPTETIEEENECDENSSPEMTKGPS